MKVFFFLGILAALVMKLGQLMVNGGTWNGRKILTPEWARRASSPLYDNEVSKLKYGYLWWATD